MTVISREYVPWNVSASMPSDFIPRSYLVTYSALRSSGMSVAWPRTASPLKTTTSDPYWSELKLNETLFQRSMLPIFLSGCEKIRNCSPVQMNQTRF